ncbi:acyl-CoA thioesterase II [Muribacter muris]|uniref:Acyl-CoA thioesterase 2 n=1 Tax=Muribacter muris TaxID=67855 RepID=A0A4Y9JWI7_9PAST|nr:acyl-CoA thioesterase II [Muribacter muris]MBF0785675.1 acyl-CoA thioesterase II [Muribacter muris]MBF0828346.1 acyl-CoA thioesterase II [Muribacter muris]TFV08845.1 acyl-CoA thioesterase II [Muribacter muris]
MKNRLTQLIQLLTLTPLDEHRFCGQSEDLGLPQVFGGQIVAQSLAAATQKVALERHLHSCHSYFIKAGEVGVPIIYHTEILRQGNSFTVVNVNAMQHNHLLARTMASFQRDEAGFSHQVKMPNVAEPAAFASENQLIYALAAHLPPKLKAIFQTERPFDVRIKYPNNPFEPQRLPAEQQIWAKVNGEAPQDVRLHQCLAAYFSDFHCILTMLHPHARSVMQPTMRIATLDHSMWFHRAFDFNQWLLFALDSPNAYAGRGITRGQVFNPQGELLFSYQQEGLIREMPPEK